jgi:hypothetical protein
VIFATCTEDSDLVEPPTFEYEGALFEVTGDGPTPTTETTVTTPPTTSPGVPTPPAATPVVRPPDQTG